MKRPHAFRQVNKTVKSSSSKGGNFIATVPRNNGFPITNLYWDSAVQRFVGEYDDAGGAEATIVSNPPQGAFKVTNLYWDPVSSRLSGEYEDET